VLLAGVVARIAILGKTRGNSVEMVGHEEASNDTVLAPEEAELSGGAAGMWQNIKWIIRTRAFRASVAGLLLLAMLMWPFVLREHRDHWRQAILLAATVIGVSLLPLRRARPIFLAAALAVSLLLCSAFFHGSMNWARIGWFNSPPQSMAMSNGQTDNFAAILDGRFHLTFQYILYRLDTTALRRFSLLHVLPMPIEVQTRAFLISIYMLGLFLCAGGMAVQFRRNDARFLVAITAPWLLLFAFLPQMHERYLVYAAGVGCTMVGAGLGVTLIDLLLIAQAWLMMFHPMLTGPVRHTSWAAKGSTVSSFLPFGIGSQTIVNLWKFMQGMHPDSGWMVVVSALILVSLVLWPRSPRTTELLLPS
jgi:hypothetical protein